MIDYKRIIATPDGPVKDLLWDFQGCLYMISYRFYTDESGTNDTSKFVTLAGCMMSIDEWSVLYGEWEKKLNDFGLSFFHAAEIWANEHKGRLLAEEMRKCLFRDLGEIIFRRNYTVWYAIVNKSDFAVVSGLYPLVGLTAMEFLVFGSIGSIPMMMKTLGKDGKIGIVLEKGGPEVRPFARQMIEMYEKRTGYFDTPWQVAPKQSTIGLQVADYVAWHYNRHMATTFLEGRAPSLPYFDLLKAVDPKRFISATFGIKALHRTFTGLEEHRKNIWGNKRPGEIT